MRAPYRRPPLVIREHWPDVLHRAVQSAHYRAGVYPPLIPQLIKQGYLQPGRDDGPPVPTAKGGALIEDRRSRRAVAV